MLPHSYLAGSMEGMLNPWCGDVGQITLGDPEQIAVVSGSADLLSRTWEFCNQIDHQGLLRGQSLESLSKMNWRVTDLFSVIDVLLLSAFCDTNDNPRVLEIGGGFGRTAEFLSKSIYPSMRYVNVDAVPVSLTYCFQYLRARFPDRKVSIVTRGSLIDLDSDFLVVPAWNLSLLDQLKFDISMNIESFQEISQSIVEFLHFADRQAVARGELCVSRECAKLQIQRRIQFPGALGLPLSTSVPQRVEQKSSDGSLPSHAAWQPCAKSNTSGDI